MKNSKKLLVGAVFFSCFFVENVMAWKMVENEVVSNYSLDFINGRVLFTSVSGNEYNYKWSSSEIDANAKSFLSVFMAAKATGAYVTVFYDPTAPYAAGSTTRWNLEQIVVK
ncbi:MAG: hypothetical protein ABW185_07285 [Sedimenticola sp.]